MPMYRFEFIGGPGSPTSALLDLQDDDGAKREAVAAMADIYQEMVAQSIDTSGVAIEVTQDGRLIERTTPMMLDQTPEE